MRFADVFIRLPASADGRVALWALLTGSANMTAACLRRPAASARPSGVFAFGVSDGPAPALSTAARRLSEMAHGVSSAMAYRMWRAVARTPAQRVGEITPLASNSANSLLLLRYVDRISRSRTAGCCAFSPDATRGSPVCGCRRPARTEENQEGVVGNCLRRWNQRPGSGRRDGDAKSIAIATAMPGRTTVHRSVMKPRPGGSSSDERAQRGAGNP